MQGVERREGGRFGALWELCRAGKRSETADTSRREQQQQQRDPRHGIAHGPAGGGAWPWDSGGHYFSLLGQNWQDGW